MRWLLVKLNVHLARSETESVARNLLAASTTVAVTVPFIADVAGCGELARCWKPTATGNTSANKTNAGRNTALAEATRKAVHWRLFIGIGVPLGGRLYQFPRTN